MKAKQFDLNIISEKPILLKPVFLKILFGALVILSILTSLYVIVEFFELIALSIMLNSIFFLMAAGLFKIKVYSQTT